MRTATSCILVMAALLEFSGRSSAQPAPERQFFGHYFELADAKRVVERINNGDAPGWKDATFESTPHPVTKTFGVYARKYDARLPKESTAKLAVTITWNTKTDVDLWVFEPGGEKCFYANRKTKQGGLLHEDNTVGFGPEHYTADKVAPGEYVVKVHMYSTHTKDPVPTIVTIDVTRDAGTAQATHQTFTARLAKSGDLVEVTRVK